MKEKEYPLENMIKEQIASTKMHTYFKNNIYLTEEQIQVLKKYNINYNKYIDIKGLMYVIERELEIMNSDDLEDVLISLSEFNYYHNTHK